jgi:hypothetical protein
MSSDTQFNTLKWTYASSAILSVTGSAIIMWHARHKLKKPYHRILFMLSTTDLISSLSLAIMPPAFFSPNQKPSAIFSLDGFIVVSMNYSSAWYNASLSAYFLLTIKYSYSERKIAQKVEPFIHGVSLIYPITSAIIGLVLQMYNPSTGNVGCWMNAYPENCEWDADIECERGEGAYLFSLFAAIIPLVLVWIALIANNVAIYCFVRQLEARSSQYTFVSRNLPTTRSQPRYVGSSDEPFESDFTAAPNSNSGVTDTQRLATITASLTPTRTTRPTSIVRPQNQETFIKTRQIAVQSFFYVFAYLMVFIFAFFLFILESIDPVGFESGNYFPLQVLGAMFFPLQGLFDALIYLRPRYYRFRKHFPEKPWWFSVQKAVLTRATPEETAADIATTRGVHEVSG